MLVTIQFRRGTAAQWNSVDPVLSLGEPGFDTTSLRIKLGDGVSHWTELEWSTVTPEQMAQLIELLEESSDLDDARMTNVLQVESSDFTVALAALMESAGNPIGDALSATFTQMGDQAKFDTFLASLDVGTAYVWNLTDPAVGLVDILSGVKA